MSRRQKDPRRPLLADERAEPERLCRAQAEPAALVARAKALLAVADGHSFAEAASLAGRRSGDAVAQLVGRFNRAGLAALEPGNGGGQMKRFTSLEKKRILQEAPREPDREEDGTASWSLSTLKLALRRAPDGPPAVSTYTIWSVLREAAFVWSVTIQIPKSLACCWPVESIRAVGEMGQITGGLVASRASRPGIDLIDAAKSGFSTHTSRVSGWLPGARIGVGARPGRPFARARAGR